MHPVVRQCVCGCWLTLAGLRAVQVVDVRYVSQISHVNEVDLAGMLGCRYSNMVSIEIAAL